MSAAERKLIKSFRDKTQNPDGAINARGLDSEGNPKKQTPSTQMKKAQVARELGYMERVSLERSSDIEQILLHEVKDRDAIEALLKAKGLYQKVNKGLIQLANYKQQSPKAETRVKLRELFDEAESLSGHLISELATPEIFPGRVFLN